MSWKRGGSEGLYTKDGLPLEMEVSITVQDLYPVLAMTHNYSALRYNSGLNFFLENMAGMSVDRFTPGKDFWDTFRLNTVSKGTGYLERLSNNSNQWIQDTAKKITGQNR